jgi:hypothetical protein
MKRTISAVAVAIFLGGCSDSVLEPMDAQFNKGVAHPFTEVNASGTATTIGSELVNAGGLLNTECELHEDGTWTCTGLPLNSGNSNTFNLGNDICVEGYLYKSTGSGTPITKFGRQWYQVGRSEHSQCNAAYAPVPGELVIVTFGPFAANYVLSTNGNMALNFKGDTDGFVHYQLRHDRSSGGGILTGAGDDGSEWTMDLAQLSVAGDVGLAAMSVSLTAYEVGGADRQAVIVMTWNPAKANQ